MLIDFEKQYAKLALDYMDELIASGLVCEMSVFDTRGKTAEYAAKKGIRRMDIIGEIIEQFDV